MAGMVPTYSVAACKQFMRSTGAANIRLKPHEILQKLGFNLGEEGVVINPNDAFLCDRTLGLIGATIDVGKVSDVDLTLLRRSCAFLVHRKLDAPDNYDLTESRTFLAELIKHQFKFIPHKFS